jgi:hypothetical protein
VGGALDAARTVRHDFDEEAVPPSPLKMYCCAAGSSSM